MMEGEAWFTGFFMGLVAAIGGAIIGLYVFVDDGPPDCEQTEALYPAVQASDGRILLDYPDGDLVCVPLEELAP